VRPRRSPPAAPAARYGRGAAFSRPTGLRRGSPTRRLQAGLCCIAFALALVAGRLVQLQGLDQAKYRKMSEHQRLHTASILAVRGAITTADGTTLAMTVPVVTVSADPPQITGATPKATSARRQQTAGLLAGLLHMAPATIVKLLDHPTSRDYVVLAKAVPEATGSRIEALITARKLTGIYLTPGYARTYPNGDLASNLVGFTTTNSAGDMAGKAGIEQSLNSRLAGRDGQQTVEIGLNGQPIPVATDRVRPVVPGSTVRLTILSSLQWKAQQACAGQVRRSHADSCTVVVLEPSTGRILALAQYPTYQPAKVTNLAATADLPVSAIFPPGSTAKVITAAAALERGGQTPMSPYTVPPQITVDGFTVHDAEPHPTEKLTLAGVVAHSSNVGMAQVAERISKQVQYQYLRAFGIGQPTRLPLPGASNGILHPPSTWWGNERYTLAYGQGMSATAVQMASVYATIANGGVRVQPTIVAGTRAPDGAFVPAPAPQRHRVIKAITAQELIAILQQVPMLDASVGEPWGEIPGYSIASKTGTAQEEACLCQYGSSYIGMAPATHPQVVVAVNVQHPRVGGYYGNMVAGPVFNQVMKFALQTLKIPPDGGKRPNVRLTAP
jgi:cell division protein FtsI (penicillin-binding protein 3)